MSYRFLVLTDHTKHSKENSIYALMTKLSHHNQCGCVHVASRGNSANRDFFYTMDSTELEVYEINDELVFQENGEQFIIETKRHDISEYDALIMRVPRPVSDDFLRHVARLMQGKPIINHPLGIIQTSTKAFLKEFPDSCPPIELCYSMDSIRTFSEKYPMVLKPLKEYGGKGIVRIQEGIVSDGNNNIPLDEFLESKKDFIQKEGYLAMKYLKNVSQGDKRILVVGGEIMASSLRLPKEGSWLCNVAQGGRSVPAKVTEREVGIIKDISPTLLKKGILIFGADTLVDDDGGRVLSEINTLSIGGFPQAEKQTGIPIVSKTIDKIVEYVANW